MRSIVIADEDTVLGFRFAGIEGRVVETSSEALAALDEIVRLPDVGMIILTERVAAGIRKAVDTMRFGSTLPLVVEIPGLEGPSESRRTFIDLIREAVGISI